MSIKKHYKLYKAGKQWCVAAITTAAIVAGMAGTIHADSNTSAVQTQPVEQEAKVSQNENNIKDNQVTDAKTSNQTAMVTDQTASADKAATGDTTNTPAANKDADQQSVSTPRASEATVESCRLVSQVGANKTGVGITLTSREQQVPAGNNWVTGTTSIPTMAKCSQD